MSVTVLKPKKEEALQTQSAPSPAETGHHPLLTLREEVDRLFDDVFSGSLIRPFGRFGSQWPRMPRIDDRLRAAWPKADMAETDKAFTITAELPGMKEGDVKVTLSGNALTVSGEKTREVDEDEGDYHLMERSYGSVRRTFGVPDKVDIDKIGATFEDGVLTITMPKAKAKEERAKTIPVKGAKEMKKPRKSAKPKSAA